MTTDEITWQRENVQSPEPCRCGAKPLPIGGPEGGAVVHAQGCPQGGRHGIT